nr:EOG090X0A0V [Lepidurus arcticus]
MKRDLYEAIVARLKDLPARNCLRILVQEFSEAPKETLSSIANLVIQRRTKRLHHRFRTRDSMEMLYTRQGVTNGDEPGVLLRIADDTGLTPALLARFILEFHYENAVSKNVEESNSSVTRNLVTTLTKNTHGIEDGDLALEIYMCNLQDDFYGPYSEAVKAGIGHEYEQKLCRILRQHNVPFCDENDLRNRGYDKTPDVKLDVPIAVDGFVVNWIECKAVFGDPDVHSDYLRDQLWSYWNRFGSGMVIYWFGFVEGLDSGKEKGILVRDSFPSVGSITFMNVAS